MAPLLRYALWKRGGEIMKKMALLLAFILVVSAPLSVSAATYILSIKPHLSFNGTTATCEVTVVGNTFSDSIEVEMKLMHGTNCVDSWTASGKGYVHMREYADVTKGQTYTVEVTVTINGITKTPVTQSGTC